MVCCDTPFKDIPEREVIKREIEGENRRSNIPYKVKREIKESQNNRCIYCDIDLTSIVFNEKRNKMVKIKTHYDHFVSWNYSRDNQKQNIYVSCHICNGIKSDKYFSDLISAREYILTIRKQKGYEDKNTPNKEEERIGVFLR